jgi:hypothetical protein
MRKRFAAESADEPWIGCATMSAATRARYSSAPRSARASEKAQKLADAEDGGGSANAACLLS